MVRRNKMTEPLWFSSEPYIEIFHADKMRIICVDDKIDKNTAKQVVVADCKSDKSSDIMEITQDELDAFKRLFINTDKERVVATNNQSFIGFIMMLIKEARVQNGATVYYCGNKIQECFIKCSENEICLINEKGENRESEFSHLRSFKLISKN